MKKIFISLLTIILLFVTTIPVNAASPVTKTVKITTFENGYRAIITTETFENVTTARAASSITTSRTYELENNSGKIVAAFKLTAKFSYNGSTSSCTSATYSTSIFNDEWSFTEASANRSGNRATGSFTAKLIHLGITRQTISDTVTLTCDKNGNIY